MSQRGPYSAPLTPAAITTTADLFHITVAAESPVTLMAMTLYQTSDVSDAQEEVLSIALARTTTGGGTGGTALTEVHYGDAGGSTVSAAVLGLNTTVTTGGTVIEHIGWNVRVPLLWVPIPELRPSFDSTQDPVAFRLLAAPGDSITIGGTVWWYEG